MLTSLRRNGLLGSAIATAIAFAILMSLGTWQMQRKAWKESLLAQIAERTHAPPVPLTRVISDMTASFPEGYDPEYRHVSVTGRFLHDKEQFLWAPDPDAGMGYHVYTPLEVSADEVVWINRGFVPHAQKAPETRSQGQTAGEVTVTGLVRKPVTDPGMFTPDNEAYRQMYYWRAIDEMHAAAFGNASIRHAPYFVDADKEPANAGGLPKGGATLVALPNRHLEYAITWYGLAGTLLAIYAAFVVARLKRAKDEPESAEIR